MHKYKHIIFIHRPHTKIGGLPIIDKRNQFVMTQFADKISVFSIDRFQVLGKSRLSKYILFFKIFFGIKIPVAPIEELVGKINDDTLVFISHSTCGLISAMIKASNPSVKIITFFHNIEADYFLEVFRHTYTLGALRSYIISLYTERLTIKHSNKVLVLNNRDKRLMSKRYGSCSAFLLPTSLCDRFEKGLKKPIMSNGRLSLLFVGTYFLSNKQGVEWLIKNIVPFVDADFYIVGIGMEQLCPVAAPYKNVFVTGKVSAEKLDEFYYSANIFISTLFVGGGMKTKIAEAMMFALPIIGTIEAFQGYDGIEDQVGLKSQDAKEMITFINQLTKDPELLKDYSDNARQFFLREYSYKSSIGKMQEILEKE